MMKIKGIGQIRRENGNGKAEFGLAVLSALSVAGIHSAVNPSFFTLKAFARKPEERANAIQGLWIGLGLGALASVSVGIVFKRWIPAIVSAGTAVALFGIGMGAVNSNGVESPTMDKKPVDPGWYWPSTPSPLKGLQPGVMRVVEYHRSA